MTIPINVTVQPEYRLTDDDIDRLATAIAERMSRPQALTPKDAAAMLDCSTHFLTTLERAGLLRPIRWGSNWTRYDARQIDHLLRHPEIVNCETES